MDWLAFGVAAFLTVCVVMVVVWSSLLTGRDDDEFPLRDDTKTWQEFLAACERQFRDGA